MKTPHKHAELIKAWADGAEIEVFDEGCRRFQPSPKTPAWDENTLYRIKPEPKHDVVTFDCVQVEHEEAMFAMGDNNLKLTWCGETGKLKSAEVIG